MYADDLPYLFVYNALNYVPKNLPEIGDAFKPGLRFYAFTIEGVRCLARVTHLTFLFGYRFR